MIGSQPTNEQERVYYAVAQKIANSEIMTANAALEGLKAVYPNDDAFKVAFAEKTIRTRKIAEDNADWTPERIAARQKALAKWAITVWRVAQLS